jgi:hypothetical protein
MARPDQRLDYHGRQCQRADLQHRNVIHLSPYGDAGDAEDGFCAHRVEISTV